MFGRAPNILVKRTFYTFKKPMSTAGPKDQIGQGIDGARTILDFNNSATSATKDRLF
ncbi:hypothetical protein KBC03_01665 [Patescibacteria group bacterium]|nr:hypothetical protein [Patescibacteria group bacterium]